MVSRFLHIPNPEDLPPEVLASKWAQVQWLAKEGLLSNNGTQQV